MAAELFPATIIWPGSEIRRRTSGITRAIVKMHIPVNSPFIAGSAPINGEATLLGGGVGSQDCALFVRYLGNILPEGLEISAASLTLADVYINRIRSYNMKDNPHDLKWNRTDKRDLEEPWRKLLPSRFRHVQWLMEETRASLFSCANDC
jgi:hypothetical protein